MKRRTFLEGTAIGIVGLSGCIETDSTSELTETLENSDVFESITVESNTHTLVVDFNDMVDENGDTIEISMGRVGEVESLENGESWLAEYETPSNPLTHKFDSPTEGQYRVALEALNQKKEFNREVTLDFKLIATNSHGDRFGIDPEFAELSE